MNKLEKVFWFLIIGGAILLDWALDILRPYSENESDEGIF